MLFSTDCVFWQAGEYSGDIPDAEDLYGRTKYCEVPAPHVITLSSMIDGNSAYTLISFLSGGRPGPRIPAYDYTGFSTIEMARIVSRVLTMPTVGRWHGKRLSKYDLLMLVREKFGLRVEIDPYDDFSCDRNLSGTRFVPQRISREWATMIDEMAEAIHR